MSDFLDGFGIVGSALGGFGDFIGSIFGNGRPSLSAQLDVSKQMAQYQHDLNMEAWREQNAYNDPSAQMQRLKDAGLNPHSIAGNASVAGNASGVPTTQVDTPDVSGFQRKINFNGLMTMAQSLSSLQSMIADRANKDEDTKLKQIQGEIGKEDILNRQITRESMNIQNEYARLKILNEGEMFKHDLAFRQAETKRVLANIREINQRMDNYNVQLDNIRANTANINANTENTKSNTKLTNTKFKIEEALYNHFYGKGRIPEGTAKGWDIITGPLSPLINHVLGDLAQRGIDVYDEIIKNWGKNGTIDYPNIPTPSSSGTRSSIQ